MKPSRTCRLLRSPWPCLSDGGIEGDRGPDERLERARVDLLPLMDVHRAPDVPVEARVEELGWVLQRSPLGEGQLHDRLVRLAGADDPVVRPCGSARVRRLPWAACTQAIARCLTQPLQRTRRKRRATEGRRWASRKTRNAPTQEHLPWQHRRPERVAKQWKF